MSEISEDDLKIIETESNYIKYKNTKALFKTKISSSMRHNDEVVDVLGVEKGRDIFHDAYIVRFNDDTIENNIMNVELKFDYIRDNAYIECRKILSKKMRQYDLNDKEAEELYVASINYDYEANDGTVFTTIESVERLFTEEDSEVRIQPTTSQLKAMAEYIKETESYYMLYGYEEYTEKVIDLILNKDENDITRLDLLNEVKNMINHNIMCYSSDLLLKKPKQGYEKEFATENKKLILIEQIIKEEREKEKVKNKKVKSKSKER